MLALLHQRKKNLKMIDTCDELGLLYHLTTHTSAYDLTWEGYNA